MSLFGTPARSGVILIACFLLDHLFAMPAQAEGLTLDQALTRSLKNHPALAVYPAARREADASRRQASLKPAPELELELENIAGSGPFQGTDSGEYTLGLSQTLELGNQRQVRQEVAQWQQRRVDDEYEIARTDVLAETARRFIECARAQALHEWAQRRLNWARRSAEAAREKARAGAGLSADVTRLEIAELRAQIAVRRFASETYLIRTELAAQWGATMPDFVMVDADLRSLPIIPSEAEWQKHLQNAPKLAQFATQERLLAAQRALATAQATPDVKVNLGLRHLEAENANALVLGASLPLAFGQRNRVNTTIAQAQYERNRAEQNQATLDLQAQLRSLYQHLRITRDEAELLRQQILPKAAQAFTEYEKGYAAGRFSTLELLSAQDEQLGLEREAINAETSFHLQHIALKHLTGYAIGEVTP